MTEMTITSPWDVNDLNVLPEDVDAVGNTMETVLARIIETFGLANVELPERRYVWFGAVPHDCELVAVSLIQMYLGSPGDQAVAPQPCHGPRTLVLSCQIVRCVPTTTGRQGATPKASALGAYAKNRAKDAWILMEAGLKTCDVWGVGAITDVTMSNPQGGYQGVVLNLTVPVV